MNTSRRWFLQSASAIGAAFASSSRGFARSAKIRRAAHRDLGPLVPDPGGVVDLPDGFTYQVISRVGDEMDDGLIVPGAPDGMAAFPSADGKTRVVRNHELMPGAMSPFGNEDELIDRIDADLIYDVGTDVACGGGTTTFVYDTQAGKLERQFVSLAGTLRNCAGGPTPWGSWVTCEEAPVLASGPYTQDHGFTFEVPSSSDGPVDPIPLVDMGRFNHEAIAVDEKSGAVYQTEDRPDSLLYRYLPTTKGDLAGGGQLQVLAIVGAPSTDTRNWFEFSDFPIGSPVEVAWIDMEDVLSPNDDLRYVGFLKGAARFARGEGMWAGDGVIWFACTSGGRQKCGQIFRYTPSEHEGRPLERKNRGTIELFLESEDKSQIDYCDNLTVAPWGDLILCEDGPGDNFLLGVSRPGAVYPFARNAGSPSEFAGATFAPDGSTLFVNIQGPGLTLAIRGPWPTT
jgi:secreted PhoX family phosphatase